MGFKTAFVLVLFPITNVLADGVRCNISVDITNGVQEGTSIISDGITYNESNYYFSGGEIRGCICNIKMCIRKCCLEGEVLNTTSRSCESSTNGATGITTYHIVNVPDNQICDEEETRIKLEQNFQIVDGVLVWEEDRYDLEDFCVDRVENSQVALLCVRVEEEMNRLVLCIGQL